MSAEKINNSWNEYQKLVLKTLDLHEEKLNEIMGTLTNIKVELGMLKIKAGVWGLLAGAVPVAVTLLLLTLKKTLGFE